MDSVEVAQQIFAEDWRFEEKASSVCVAFDDILDDEFEETAVAAIVNSIDVN